ncbi:hypothetical protein CYMTET_23343 [Cymbomonas tetramitiformis]|uniref:Uncharacterized protein n=1 Tax=Cymbomonas tetramitiformis TaxID=36881 RepID=A0AAE0FYV7_9CHLO|nr:hypothetical protein CYMTET_23343 [Cymbomonas tetramitiformis]
MGFNVSFSAIKGLVSSSLDFCRQALNERRYYTNIPLGCGLGVGGYYAQAYKKVYDTEQAQQAANERLFSIRKGLSDVESKLVKAESATSTKIQERDALSKSYSAVDRAFLKAKQDRDAKKKQLEVAERAVVAAKSETGKLLEQRDTKMQDVSKAEKQLSSAISMVAEVRETLDPSYIWSSIVGKGK